jgi:hypothetical protein
MATSPPNSNTAASGSRVYTWPGDSPLIEYPSVTTILNVLNKPALAGWAAREAAAYAVANLDDLVSIASRDTEAARELIQGAPWRKSRKAMKRGSDTHDAAERHALGLKPDMPDEEAAPYVDGLRRFLDEWQPEIEMSEAVVYSRRYRYAGQLDGIGTFPGMGRVLFDFKTGKAVYDEAVLQVCAYRNADFIGLPDGSEVPVPAVDTCAIVRITPGAYEVVPIATEGPMFEFFVDCVRLHQWKQHYVRPAIGRALPVPTREAVPS